MKPLLTLAIFIAACGPLDASPTPEPAPVPVAEHKPQPSRCTLLAIDYETEDDCLRSCQGNVCRVACRHQGGPWCLPTAPAACQAEVCECQCEDITGPVQPEE